MRKAQLRIEGMTCGHCEKFVAMVLSTQPGATEVVVSQQNGRAELNVENEKCLDEAVNAVNATGTYKVISRQFVN